MPEDVALICAVAGCTVEDAGDILSRAEALGVDPLDLVHTEDAINQETVFERAARWSGLAFSSVVPGLAYLPGRPARIDTLAQVRSLRLELFDREILFVAPRFRSLLALAARARMDPDIIRRVCIVPPAELRRALTSRCRRELIDFSRQRLSQIWPFATAHLDLGLALRLGFVAVLLVLLVVAVAAPFEARPGLIALLFVLLVPPAWFRIAAIVDGLDPLRDADPPRAGDAELPVYSVLVPLRDEAHMVPQLMAALGRLDYPALCIKRTS